MTSGAGTGAIPLVSRTAKRRTTIASERHAAASMASR
jgi:hypothetical protein